jgi:hypothetical protein
MKNIDPGTQGYLIGATLINAILVLIGGLLLVYFEFASLKFALIWGLVCIIIPIVVSINKASEFEYQEDRFIVIKQYNGVIQNLLRINIIGLLVVKLFSKIFL